MTLEKVVAILFVATIGVVAAILIARKLPKRPKQKYYIAKWRELQKFCSNKDTWPVAIITADTLLDHALKKRRFSGKTMGERLVSAQREFSDNDAVWFAHKLRNKIAHEEDVKLKESDVKEALLGFRQALKDLGAL